MRIVVSLFIAAFAFQNSSAPPGPEQPAVFHDASLQFSFEYPANLKVNEQVGPQAVEKAKQGSDGAVKRAAECLTSPLVAVENAGQQNFGFVMITESDFKCENQDTASLNGEALSQLAGTALETAMKMLGEPHIGEPTSYRVAGHLASMAEGKIDAATSKSRRDIFGESACVVVQNDVVCFNAMSADRARLHELLGGSIHFDDATTRTPLVPASALNR